MWEPKEGPVGLDGGEQGQEHHRAPCGLLPQGIPRRLAVKAQLNGPKRKTICHGSESYLFLEKPLPSAEAPLKRFRTLEHIDFVFKTICSRSMCSRDINSETDAHLFAG